MRSKVLTLSSLHCITETNIMLIFLAQFFSQKLFWRMQNNMRREKRRVAHRKGKRGSMLLLIFSSLSLSFLSIIGKRFYVCSTDDVHHWRKIFFHARHLNGNDKRIAIVTECQRKGGRQESERYEERGK